MVKRIQVPDAEVTAHPTRKSPRSALKSPTMSDSAKPKSSTSEASKRQTRKPLIRRSNSSDDDDDSSDNISEPSKPKTPAAKSRTPITKPTKTPANKKKAIHKSSDSGDDESEEEQPKRSATATKSATAKKESRKRVRDSDDGDEVISLRKKSIKTKPKTSASSMAKKQTAKKQLTPPSSSRAIVEDYDDESDEDDTKSKPKSSTSYVAKKPVAKKQRVTSANTQDVEPDSENDSDEHNIKSKPKTSASSTTKKQPGKAPIPVPEDDEEEDNEDESDEEEPAITLSEYKGDLFGAPAKSLLLHACNCEGSWNKGIAYQFQKNYPDHYALYHNHCRDKGDDAIIGTCLLIPPQNIGRNHWVGCLFTSRKYGRGKDKKDKILQNTEDAIQDMVDQLVDMEAKKRPAEVWMCKINSGLFRVPWDDTKERIRYITCKGGLHITIMDKK